MLSEDRSKPPLRPCPLSTGILSLVPQPPPQNQVPTHDSPELAALQATCVSDGEGGTVISSLGVCSQRPRGPGTVPPTCTSMGDPPVQVQGVRSPQQPRPEQRPCHGWGDDTQAPRPPGPPCSGQGRAGTKVTAFHQQLDRPSKRSRLGRAPSLEASPQLLTCVCLSSQTVQGLRTGKWALWREVPGSWLCPDWCLGCAEHPPYAGGASLSRAHAPVWGPPLF